VEHEPGTTVSDLPAKSRMLSPFACFVLGSCFAVLDAVSTWYALRFTRLPEGNPALRWAFDQVGLTAALVLRVVVGSAALALLAWGVSARLPRHERLFNLGCQILLVSAVVIWGTVAVSNIAQIVYVRFR
jgi:Domain of unknown function (DUF5658)